jgi:hypothetical protein
LIFFLSLFFSLNFRRQAIENSSQSADQAFESLFGKEKADRVRCYGRTATPSMLKKKEQIANIKKQ